jgi:hypothetical protein
MAAEDSFSFGSKATTFTGSVKYLAGIVSTSYAERQNLTMRMHMRPLHAPHQCILKEGREPCRSVRAAFDVLQFRAASSDAQDQSRNGRWRDEPALGNGRRG